MKLSKTLLSAILVGIAVQTLPSCKKSNDSPNFKQQLIELRNKAHHITPPYPYNCPACGMG